MGKVRAGQFTTPRLYYWRDSTSSWSERHRDKSGRRELRNWHLLSLTPPACSVVFHVVSIVLPTASATGPTARIRSSNISMVSD